MAAPLILDVEDVAKIVSSGGGVLVSASRGSSELSTIARNLASGAKLRITDSALLSASDMLTIARNSPGNVSFE